MSYPPDDIKLPPNSSSDCECGPWGKCLAHNKPVKTTRPIKASPGAVPLRVPEDSGSSDMNLALLASLVVNVLFLITIIILVTSH